ncbi:hypothetical protein CBS14141_002048 [Malassezia furfur]|nr:hypothetical protein CBS14141_002048 [Malassezia furfur]
MMSDTLSCRLALSDEELCAAYNIRHEVFIKEQGFDPELEIDSVKGALRIIPCPLPSEELTFLGSQRKDHSPPGRGRTEEQVIASIAKPQEVVRGSPDGRSVLLSGVKLGRIVVSSSLRGQGAGRFLVDSAEKWAIEALTQVPVQQGVKEVDAMIQLSGQVRARKFYDRLDDISAHLLLINESDKSIQGTLRIIPLPLPEEPLMCYSRSRKDQSPPGHGRSEAQVIAAIVDRQQVLEQSVDSPSALLSGVKLGRIVISSEHRGRGAGRYLLDSAEKWVIQALSNTPVSQGTKTVDANIELSALVIARKFYDR